MVQEFVDDVLVNWETKLVFFDRVYSHAILGSPIHGGVKEMEEENDRNGSESLGECVRIEKESRFFNRENRDFHLNANTLSETNAIPRAIVEEISHESKSESNSESKSSAKQKFRCGYYPDEYVIAKASKVLDLIDGRLPYARVDVVVGTKKAAAPVEAAGGLLCATGGSEDGDTGGGNDGATGGCDDGATGENDGGSSESPAGDSFKKENMIHLMEVELIEPSLYFDSSSAVVFGNLVLEMIEKRKLQINAL